MTDNTRNILLKHIERESYAVKIAKIELAHAEQRLVVAKLNLHHFDELYSDDWKPKSY